MNGTSGDIYEYNWGNGNYQGGHYCTWTIEVPAENVVRAELVTSSFGASTNDNVTVSSQYGQHILVSVQFFSHTTL